MESKFLLGRLAATRGVADKIEESKDFARFARRSFNRYISGDWGELDASDKRQNDEALLRNDNRLFAEYTHDGHPEWRLWIITEWDRSATTLLFPDEY